MSEKVAVVFRTGGFGDTLWALPVLRKLKSDGYKVIFHTTDRVKEVFENEDCIDELVAHSNGNVSTLVDFKLPEGARLVDLSMLDDRVVEGKHIWGCMLHAQCFVPGCYNCVIYKNTRDNRLNGLNHEDLVVQGFNVDGPPQMNFTAAEIAEAHETARDWPGKFVVIWAQSNSAEFKIYPHWFDLMSEFLVQHNDAVVYSVGTKDCTFLQVEHERIVNITGKWGYRKSALMCSMASLVVGVEGALMAGCAFDPVPKLMLMTVSHPNNVAKNWVNTVCVQPKVPCHPCHQMHRDITSCPLVGIHKEKPIIDALWPICLGIGFQTRTLLYYMNEVYNKARAQMEAVDVL